jgi:protein-S-isoprenylcysteine O-methyltransferase Ste14
MKRLLRSVVDLPPVWMLGFLVVIWGQAKAWNPFGFQNQNATLAGWVLIVLAVLLSGWAALKFLKKRTSIVPRNTPSAFIAEGPYRISRNPIYLADALVVLGWALVMGSTIGLILVPVFMGVITKRFITAEEAGLKAAYPDSQTAFFRKTRRWL